MLSGDFYHKDAHLLLGEELPEEPRDAEPHPDVCAREVCLQRKRDRERREREREREEDTIKLLGLGNRS